MATLEKRIETLEQASVKAEDLNKIVIFPHDGESTADALVRSGYPADTPDVVCVRFVKAIHAQS